MTAPADSDLYRRGVNTVLASWEEYARGANGAEVRRLPGVATAIFPNEPERGVYNNAILERDLAAAERAGAVATMEAAYAAVGVTRFAAWVHESDTAMRAELELRGYALEESTRAMGMTLTDLGVPRPEIELASTDWDEYLCIFGLPSGLLRRADHSVFHLLAARLERETVATAMAFDHDGDCGIYNVATVAHARRRGLGTALTAAQLHDAVARGCRTASVQSTKMAERVYTAVGFRDLGRILEYTPSNGAGRSENEQATNRRRRLHMAEFPAPNDGILLTHFIVSDDVERSRRFYTDVLGGETVLEGEPTIVALANGWVTINVGGGPTEDKPTVTLETPSDPDRTSAFLNIRVADIQAVYSQWSARGAEFLTPPQDRGAEIRCYLRDPDGHLIEVGQTSADFLERQSESR